MAKNYYEILGVSRDATDEQIKKLIVNLQENIIQMSVKKLMLKSVCKK